MTSMSEIKSGEIYLTSEDEEQVEFPATITNVTFDEVQPDSGAVHQLAPWNFESSFEIQLTREASEHLKRMISRITSNNYQKMHGGHVWRKQAHAHSRINQIRNQSLEIRTRATVTNWLNSYLKMGHSAIDLWTHKDMPKSIVLLYDGENVYLSIGVGWKHDYRKWKKNHADFDRKETT